MQALSQKKDSPNFNPSKYTHYTVYDNVFGLILLEFSSIQQPSQFIYCNPAYVTSHAGLRIVKSRNRMEIRIQ